MAGEAVRPTQTSVPIEPTSSSDQPTGSEPAERFTREEALTAPSGQMTAVASRATAIESLALPPLPALPQQNSRQVAAHLAALGSEEDPLGNVLVCCSPVPRLTLGPLLAAEVTQVSPGTDLTFGYRAGVQGAFRLSERLRLNAALAIGRRNYHAGLDDTGMPAELFAGHVRPHSTVGSATVLEVPIGIDYYPESAGSLSWFLSASVNSYRYLTEEMAFEYPEARPGQFRRMRDPRPDGTLAASLRLGGGLWLRCGAGPSVRISPYVELPLRAQAYSEVSLYNAGLKMDVPLLSF